MEEVLRSDRTLWTEESGVFEGIHVVDKGYEVRQGLASRLVDGG